MPSGPRPSKDGGNMLTRSPPVRKLKVALFGNTVQGLHAYMFTGVAFSWAYGLGCRFLLHRDKCNIYCPMQHMAKAAHLIMREGSHPQTG